MLSSSVGDHKVAILTKSAGLAGYGISKAALNLAVAKYAARFKDEGIIFLSITPGLVKTLQGCKSDLPLRASLEQPLTEFSFL